VRLGPLLALTVATFALGFGELMIAGILPDAARDLHVSVGTAGSLVGVYALVFATLSAPLALALARVERRTALVAALLLVAAANAGAAAGGGFAVVLAMRVLAAAGSAVATTIALAAVDALADAPSRGRAHGIVFAGFSAAATLGVPLSVLVADRWSWRDAFAGVAVSAFIAATLVALTVPRLPRARPLAWNALASVLLHRPLVMTLAVSLLTLTAQYLVFTYIRPYVDATGGFDATVVAALLLLYGGVGIAGNLAGGALVDRYGAARTILACVGGMLAVYLGLGLLMRTLPGAVLALVVWALVSWGYAPAVNQRLASEARGAPELALALNLAAFNAGIAIGSAAGAITIAIGGPLALPAAGAVVLAGALVVAWKTPNAEPDGAA